MGIRFLGRWYPQSKIMWPKKEPPILKNGNRHRCFFRRQPRPTVTIENENGVRSFNLTISIKFVYKAPWGDHWELNILVRIITWWTGANVARIYFLQTKTVRFFWLAWRIAVKLTALSSSSMCCYPTFPPASPDTPSESKRVYATFFSHLHSEV